jgi:hypothetical protein
VEEEEEVGVVDLETALVGLGELEDLRLAVGVVAGDMVMQPSLEQGGAVVTEQLEP